jgi:hypothetical protein
MYIEDIRAKQVIDIQDDKDQVIKSPMKQASDSQVQDQGVSSSSPTNGQPSASNQDQVLQPSHIARDHPLDLVISDIRSGVQTRSRLFNFCKHYSFVSLKDEPENIKEALESEDWILAMQNEFNNFKRNDV